MLNIILPIALLSLLFCIIIIGIKYDAKKTIFSLEENKAIRGIWSIIIILVHVPDYYQNRIQDLLGSFAYIGVTMFFMFSSYGLLYSTENKSNYLKLFWKNRFLKLFIPCMIVTIINILLKAILSTKITINDFIINKWVLILLLFNVIFYFTHFKSKSNNMMIKSNIYKNLLIIAIVSILSIITEVTHFKVLIRWQTESFGFVYGIIFYYYNRVLVKKQRDTNNCIYYFGSILFFTILSATVGVMYLKYKLVFFVGSYLLKILLGLLIILLIIIVLERFSIGNKISKFLGDISYSTYLCQFVIFQNFNNIKCIDNSHIYILCSCIIIIVFSFLVNTLCKRIYKSKVLNI